MECLIKMAGEDDEEQPEETEKGRRGSVSAVAGECRPAVVVPAVRGEKAGGLCRR